MTINYPGPYEIRMFYTTTVSSVPITHVQHLSLQIVGDPDPGDEFISMNTILRDASTPTLDSVASAWATACQPLFSSGAGNTIDYMELWRYTFGTFEASFISAKSIGVAGTSGSTVQGSSQSISTFRTQEGGIFKLSFMETVITPGPKDTAPYGLAALESIAADIVAGDTYPWIGRDTSFPFARIAHYPGQNEALFKRRNGRKA